MIKKTVLMNVEKVYTANSFICGNKRFVAAGSEVGPEVKLLDFSSGESCLVSGCPGGVMSFVPVPGRNDVFYSIMGLFPGFVGLEAGVYIHKFSNSGWESRRVFHIPFAHRCEIISRNGTNYLFAVSVSRHKDAPSDWSKAGDIFMVPLDPVTAEPSRPDATLVDSNVFRNHGMLKIERNGCESLMISGAEGIFSLEPKPDGSCVVERLFDSEVSEFGFVDLDGDGVDELVTIEPFHGSNLCVYKLEEGKWCHKFSSNLSFGHGLSCGKYNGDAVIVVGNRRGPLTLQLLKLKDASDWSFDVVELEQEAGPTQTQVFTEAGVDYILSANQLKNEVVVYHL